MLAPRPLYSTGVVAFTWWLALAFLAFFVAPASLLGALSRGATILGMAAIGSLLGIAFVFGWVALNRNTTRRLLAPDEVRGMRCSIGEVPFLINEPKSVDVLPNFTEKDLPDVRPGFFNTWIEKYRISHPAHVALMEKLLRIYLAHSHLPAAHITGGHGGRSLLQHSCLCADLMDRLAQSWEYKGVLTSKAKGGVQRVVLELRDKNYKFDKDDPMSAIIGLCHDIGKIEAYLYEGGKVVGIRHEHDMTGARMLARMNEVWALPDMDVFALMMSVAHYHHPMDLPLSPDRRAIDDRTIALMELLIRTDANSRAVEERGRPLSSEEEAEQLKSEDTAAPITGERLIEELTEILLEPSRIDSGDQRHNLGSYCQVLGANVPLLVLHEESIAVVLAQRLRLDIGAKVGDGRSVIGNMVRKALAERGALRTTMKCLNAGGEPQTYSAESAIWQVGYYKKGSKGLNPKTERITGYASILVEPTVFPALKGKLAPHNWIAIVEKAMYPSRAKKAKESEDPLEQGKQGAEIAAPKLPTLEPIARTSAAADGDTASAETGVADIDEIAEQQIVPSATAHVVVSVETPPADPSTTSSTPPVLAADALLEAAEQVAREGGPAVTQVDSLQDVVTSDADLMPDVDEAVPQKSEHHPAATRDARGKRKPHQAIDFQGDAEAWKEAVLKKVGPSLKPVKPNNLLEATAVLQPASAAKLVFAEAAQLRAHLETLKPRAQARNFGVNENNDAWVMAKPACELIDPALDWDASIAAISQQDAEAVGLLILPFKDGEVQGVALGVRKNFNQASR